MSLALSTLLGGLAVLGLLFARDLAARRWATTLVAYKLLLPANLTAGQVARWLAMVAANTYPTRWPAASPSPVTLEISSTASGGIAHYILVAKNGQAKLLASLQAGLPGARIEEAPEYLARQPVFRCAGEFTLTSQVRPLNTDQAEATSAALLAALQPVGSACEVRIAWMLASAGTPQPVRPAAADSNWMFGASLRIGVAAPTQAQARQLLARVCPVFGAANAMGVRMVLRWLPAFVVARGLNRRSLPLTRFPILANASELAGVLGLPLGGVVLPGLRVGAARQLPPPPGMRSTSGCVVAESDYPGTDRLLTLKIKDRLMHTYCVGPTGVGKSTLIANMALQDAAAGYGLVVIDPKGDLVPDILARLPEKRWNDIIVLDPAATADRVVGWNLLRMGHGEHARELAVDHIVHIMGELWRSSWGPRTADCLRAALLTLVHTKAADGSAFTIADVSELLGSSALQRFVLRQPGVPAAVRPFWAAFTAMSDGERAQVIGPSMNKLRAISTRTSLRLILGQSQGIDLHEIFTKRRILLVPLGKATVGAETAQLLAALLTASIYQACLSRISLPAEQRRPVVAYIDEAQDAVKLPLAIEDLLAQARGLGLALVLANQSLAQLPDSMRSAVLGIARTQIAFQCGYEDAQVLARSFGPLTADDLRGLAAHHIALKPCVDGQAARVVTGRTLPLPEVPDAVRVAAELAARSRERYGCPRAEVEAALSARVTPPGDGPSFGRQRKGGR